MKLLPLIFAAALASPLAQATTIVGSGGTTGGQFVTNAGTFLSPTNSSVQVGVYDIVNGFTQFATSDASPITIGSVSIQSLQGRWTGNFADTSSDANFFNGKQVAVRVTVDLGGGGTAFAIFLSTANFPTNTGGVGDTVNVSAASLTTLAQGTLGSAPYQAPNATYPNGFVVIGVPETSTSLLAALGAGILLRRRRRP